MSENLLPLPAASSPLKSKRKKRRKSSKKQPRKAAVTRPESQPSNLFGTPEHSQSETDSSDSGTHSLPSPNSAFASVAEDVLAPLGESLDGEAPKGEVIPPAEETFALPVIPEKVWRDLLLGLSKGIAKARKDAVLVLQDHELDQVTPAVTSLTNEKLPAWLAALFGDSMNDPRYAALIAFVGMYALRIGATKWLEPLIAKMFGGTEEEKPKANSSAQGTSTEGYPAAPEF